MATIESISKRLDALDKDRGYFKIEDLLWALEREKEGESFFEALHREHPFKTFHPDMLQSFLKDQSSGDGSE